MKLLANHRNTIMSIDALHCYNRQLFYLFCFSSLSSKGSNCLRNHAIGKPLELPTELPGVAFTVDDQCKQQYGNRARHCHKYKVLPLSVRESIPIYGAIFADVIDKNNLEFRNSSDWKTDIIPSWCPISPLSWIVKRIWVLENALYMYN